jgi:hypothetical protein
MARVPVKNAQLRAAFINIGIPLNLADEALTQFPEAEANQPDVDRLLISVGYPAGYGKVKDVPAPEPQEE